MANITAGIQNQPFGEPDIPGEILREVSELVERIERLLTDFPYDRLVDRIIRRDGNIGHHTEGGDVINVIPGNQKLACTRMTLAMSTGISPASSLGFPNVMRSVREYLTDCERMAKVVVILTDTWNPRHIEEHIGDIRAHARHGRYVIPHLVTGGRVLRVDWPRI
ncbi:MAG: hypothetical protein ACOYLU_12335 [Limisphaerales bacterium]